MKNIVRVATIAPEVHIGNPSANAKEIANFYASYGQGADLLVTPELSISGYTCGDLFFSGQLLHQSLQALTFLCEVTKKVGEAGAALLVGAPIVVEGELFNCTVLLHNGSICGIVPKTYLPNYGEFYEKRWFSARKVPTCSLRILGQEIPFGNQLLFELGDSEERVILGVEICEDAWTPISPSRKLTLAGAEVIVNLSASNEVIGKAEYRRNLIGNISASCICGYVYASAGQWESTSDVVFGGHQLVYENGKKVAECPPFSNDVLVADLMLSKIRHDRMANKSFSDCKLENIMSDYVTCHVEKKWLQKEELKAKIGMTPFVPSKNVRERCISIFQMQVAGLQRRIATTHCKCIVVGVSGGLDSTLALLVSAQAVKNLGLPSETVMGITMPGFGTTNRTKNNSVELMKALGCEIREISIVDAVRQHFKDIGHAESVQDITYENCQARERTQILMDVANKEGGFVVGTGDLSELALGWCTYNGDHMSMYAVNTSIPKTLVRTLVDEIGHHMAQDGNMHMAHIVEDIIDTPVSPELLPPNPDGTIAQKTEDTVGSYILHDFFLYYTLRFGLDKEEVLELCKEAVRQNPAYQFSDAEICKWLDVFYTRFFRQQFKRNCMPDGVKVGTVSVSPRGDLRLPSEIETQLFV